MGKPESMRKKSTRIIAILLLAVLAITGWAGVFSVYAADTTVYKAIVGEPGTDMGWFGNFYTLEDLGVTKNWSDYETAYTGSSQVALSFSDVPKGAWYYTQVMNMTKVGLFNGTTAPINGVGTFAPDGTMTRAEFGTVIARAFWPDEVKAQGNTSPWYKCALTVLREKGVLANPVTNSVDLFDVVPSDGFYLNEKFVDTSAMSPIKPITRAEACTLLVNVYKVLNLENFNATYGKLLRYDTAGMLGTFAYPQCEDETGELFNAGLWSGFDYHEAYYTKTPSKYSYMQIAYVMGLINGCYGGKGSGNTFTPIELAPDALLTRSQGATILYRALESDGRMNNVVFVTDPDTVLK